MAQAAEHKRKPHMPDNEIITLTSLPVTLPERLILSRLGFHHHRTDCDDAQQVKIAVEMRRAYTLCRPQGRSRLLAVAGNDGRSVTLADGHRWESEKLAALVGGAPWLWVGAVTLGDGIARAIAGCGDDLARATVIDATGSECADGAMDFLQDYARRQLLRRNLLLAKRRFSPGFGGLALTVQQDVFEWLNLQELGMALNAAFLMTPEKSVTAVAGVTAREG